MPGSRIHTTNSALGLDLGRDQLITLDRQQRRLFTAFIRVCVPAAQVETFGDTGMVTAHYCWARVQTPRRSWTMRILLLHAGLGQIEYFPCSSSFKGALSSLRDPSSR